MVIKQEKLRLLIREELVTEQARARRFDISESNRLVEKMFNPIMSRIGQIALSHGVDFENSPARVKTNLETAVLNALRDAVPEAIA